MQRDTFDGMHTVTTIDSGNEPSTSSSGAENQRRKRPRKKAGTPELVKNISSRLVRRDPLKFLAENCEMALEGWISMRRTTTPPENIISSDFRIVAAFKELDKIIYGQQSTQILRRLATIQLLCVFESLECIVRSDHRDGRVKLRPGYGLSSVAMDIYMSAQEPPTTRARLLERTRFARRLREFVIESPFFLIIYTSTAEAISDRYSGFDMPLLRQVASYIRQNSHSRLIIACRELEKAAELAVMSAQPCDTKSIAAEAKRYLESGTDQHQASLSV